jgi:hypothetical protein
MSFKKWQKLIAAKTPNAVEETRVAVWLDTVSSLAGNFVGQTPAGRAANLGPVVRLR